MTCAWEDCKKREYRASKYCFAHKEKARDRWKELMAKKERGRKDRDIRFSKIQADAVEAGMNAAKKCIPEPMYVEGVKEIYKVDKGVCGFAWVVHKPGNDSFSYWARKNGWERHYYGGVQWWCFDFGQSMEIKVAYCQAFSKSLNEAGIKAHYGSRID